MTKESARSEGIMSITTFNQVIEFDSNSQVWYVKNLWQGNPPMARVNTEYSEKVVEIKSNILQKALQMKDKSFKALNDITEQAHDLWKGVLNENFVFSFRNTIEIKAYMAMERVVQDEPWRLESFLRDNLINITQNSFANCDQEENLRTVANKLIKDMNDLLFGEKIKSEHIIAEFFENDRYKDIIIQWKQSQQIRFDFLVHSFEQTIKDQVEKSLEKRLVEIFKVTCHEKYEEELRKMSMSVANEYKGQELSEDTVNRLFNGIWQSVVRMVNTPTSNSEKNRKPMSDIFHICLNNIFNKHLAALKNVLEKCNGLTPLPNLKSLRGTFDRMDIDDKDIHFTLFQKGKKVIWGKTDILKYVETRVNQVLEAVDEKIKGLSQVREEITEMAVNQLMHELNSSINDILRGSDNEYKFQAPFYVKIYVHVSRHAQAKFEKHNENYFRIHGAAARLEKYREQQKISFEAHLRCRQFEDIVSKLFINVIEGFAEEWTSLTLPNKITDAFYTNLPPIKNRAIIEICSDLLKEGNFENFIRYISSPKDYASSWVTQKANDYLFAQGSRSYANISKRLLENVFRTVADCVLEVHKECDSHTPISTEKWTESLRIRMKASNFSISTESFRSVEKETKKIQNLEYLTNVIIESLKKSEDKVVSRFSECSSGSIQWVNTNPISLFIEKMWGCDEQCTFCGEPCAKTVGHTGSDHNSLQHRPLCCIGVRDKESVMAALESCEFKIQSNKTHSCGVFNYVCNDGKREECGKNHSYKSYKAYLKKWHIAPSSNMLESSKYWMWFVATYKKDLVNHFSYKLDNIPTSWFDITKSEALDSLSETYSVTNIAIVKK